MSFIVFFQVRKAGKFKQTQVWFLSCINRSGIFCCIIFIRKSNPSNSVPGASAASPLDESQTGVGLWRSGEGSQLRTGGPTALGW